MLNLNIEKNKVNLKTFKNDTKKQYIDFDKKIEKVPFIVCNRGNGNSKYEYLSYSSSDEIYNSKVELVEKMKMDNCMYLVSEFEPVTKAYWPKKSVLIASGALLGLALGIFVLVFMEILREFKEKNA